jgi:hypothetical protein
VKAHYNGWRKERILRPALKTGLALHLLYPFLSESVVVLREGALQRMEKGTDTALGTESGTGAAPALSVPF